jgi:hypothetical protein
MTEREDLAAVWGRRPEASIAAGTSDGRPDPTTIASSTRSHPRPSAARTSSVKHEDMMPIEHEQVWMWTLSADRRSVRMTLPPLPVNGLSEPIAVKIDFGAGIIEQMIERLTMLRLQMLPKPPPARKQN